MREQLNSMREEVEKIEAIDFLEKPQTHSMMNAFIKYQVPSVLNEMRLKAAKSGGESQSDKYQSVLNMISNGEVGLTLHGSISWPVHKNSDKIKIVPEYPKGMKSPLLTGRSKPTTLSILVHRSVMGDLWQDDRHKILQPRLADQAISLFRKVANLKRKGLFVPYNQVPHEPIKA